MFARNEPSQPRISHGTNALHSRNLLFPSAANGSPTAATPKSCRCSRRPPQERQVAEVGPRLREHTRSELTHVTGLTNAWYTRIRPGLAVPDPRHWEALARLA